MSDKREILSVNWFNTNGGTAGIVVINNGFKKKAYIKVVEGENEKTDIQDIMSYGSTLDINVLKNIINILED